MYERKINKYTYSSLELSNTGHTRIVKSNMKFEKKKSAAVASIHKNIVLKYLPKKIYCSYIYTKYIAWRQPMAKQRYKVQTNTAKLPRYDNIPQVKSGLFFVTSTLTELCQGGCHLSKDYMKLFWMCNPCCFFCS